ncbi:MAG: M28 family peptidase [Saprospirales bacterium]|nr:M28 family peptidase [Saprospirales bacterium]
MTVKDFSWLLALLFPALLPAQNGAPVLQNLSADVDWNTQTLTLQYDISDPENDPLEISVYFSADGGKTYSLTGQAPLSGDVGFPVLPGAGRTVTADVSLLAGGGASFMVRVVADDRQPFDLQGLVNEVDSNRLRADLQFVEGIRHRTGGNVHLNEVRDSIQTLFATLGLYAEQHTFPYLTYTGRNLLGTAPGTVAPDTVVIVDAHYDTVFNAPGADDNGSGTVGILEIARLLSRYPCRKSVRFIGFDLEESGLTGSSRYVANGIAANEEIQGVFNFEMIGYYSDKPNTQALPSGFEILFPAAAAAVAANQYRGDFITNVGNAQFPAITNLFQASAALYVPDLRVITVSEPMGFQVPDLRRSDHTPFWTVGIPAIMITDGANFRNECYHTPNDTLDNKLNFTFMSRVVKATLAAAAQMVGIRHGDWAMVSFEGTVRAADLPEQCALAAGAYPPSGGRIALFWGNCPLPELQVQLFDVKGALLHSETITPPQQPGWQPLQTPGLAPGVYVLHVQGAGGRRSFKVAVF